ncbi:hypothetical protein RD792_000726 [Penstemon davidsonii]|uniref:NAC domain-containing protein n=1 Tax=Penstemon davidsonii TaxID=160366 RepID=A0ABR0DLP7_9LAMI|nr:hypothetical protein RD792_000726 [Penstemon davidsonii]
MEMESCVPPGFRFHPTEEELVGYYLKRKVNSLKIDLDVITDLDLYRMEPWDIEDKCKLGYEEQNEWYFFSHKDRKYPTGTRTNRATAAGFWKATGRDKAVVSKERIIGMRKTLVYYKGRAPNGRKSDWIMHEYRLQTSEHGPPQEEGWVVCRAFKKPNPSQKQGYEATSYWNNNINNNNANYYTNNYSRPTPLFLNTTSNITQNFDPLSQVITTFNHDPSFPQDHHNLNQMVELPKLDSPSISTSFATTDNTFEHSINVANTNEDEKGNFGNQFNEWKNFDKLLSSQVIGSSSSSSYVYTNMALDLHNDHELDAQNHLKNVLECFPDL